MTPEELIARVRKLDAAAAPGPWVVVAEATGPEGYTYLAQVVCGKEYEYTIADEMADADANLAAEYRTLAPKLADMLERAIEGMQQMQLASTVNELFDIPAASVLQDIEEMA